MNALLRIVLILVVMLYLPTAQAETLRCNGVGASEGDSRLAVLYKCGPPVLSDAYCDTVYYVGTVNPVPPPMAAAYIPCQPVEEWLYDRGPGNLMATVRFRFGIVQSIRYGRLPQ